MLVTVIQLQVSVTLFIQSIILFIKYQKRFEIMFSNPRWFIQKHKSVNLGGTVV